MNKYSCVCHVSNNLCCEECAPKDLYIALRERIEELELLTNALKEKYNSMCAPSLRKEPFKCPVCGGNGIGEKYSMGARNDPCDSCKGNGIVWG